MIRFYWPFKSVAPWLEKIEFSGTSNGVPKVHHKGLGIIVLKNNTFHAFGIGTFMSINGAGMAVTITGQRGGVRYTDLWATVSRRLT